MEQSFIKYRGDDTTTQFVVPFPYIYRDHVYVKVALMKSKTFLTSDEQEFIVIMEGGVFLTSNEKVFRTIDNKELEVLSGQQVFKSRDRDGESYFNIGFTWITDSIIELPFAPADGDQVLMYRDSELWNKLVQYSDETMLRSEDLNIDSNQMYFLLQEVVDVGPREDIDWDAKYIRDIVNNEVSVSVTTGYILERLTDSIGRSQLLQDLRDPLETLENMHSEVTLTANQWTVKIDNNGHVVGTGLILYPSWENDKAYVVDDQVYYNEKVYVCIANHTGAEPPDALYWELVPDGVRSEFLIVADRFAVVNPANSEDLKVPFVVGNVDGVPTIGISGELVVDGSIYGNAIATDAITVGHIGDPQAILNKNQLLKEIHDDLGNRADTLIEAKLDAIIDGKTVIVNGYLNTGFIEANTITAEMIVIGDLENELGIPDWKYEDTTLIDGGKIYAGSKIQIGNLDGVSDYCKIDGGDIEFYKYANGYHHMYKSLKKIEHGSVPNDTLVTLPGPWEQPPSIQVSTADIPIYSEYHTAQDQQLQCYAEHIGFNGIDYQFKAVARLVIKGGTHTISPMEVFMNDTVYWHSGSRERSSLWYTSPNNIKKIEISPNIHLELWGRETGITVTIQCYADYGAHTVLLFDRQISTIIGGSKVWDYTTSEIINVPANVYDVRLRTTWNQAHNGSSDGLAGFCDHWGRFDTAIFTTDATEVIGVGDLTYIAVGR